MELFDYHSDRCRLLRVIVPLVSIGHNHGSYGQLNIKRDLERFQYSSTIHFIALLLLVFERNAIIVDRIRIFELSNASDTGLKAKLNKIQRGRGLNCVYREIT